MHNDENIVRNFFCDREGAKGYAELEAHNGQGWRLSPAERKALAQKIYNEIIEDFIELGMIEKEEMTGLNNQNKIERKKL